MQGETKPESWSEWRQWLNRHIIRCEDASSHTTVDLIIDEAARELVRFNSSAQPVASPAPVITDEMVERAAEVLADRAVYEGYDAETRARLKSLKMGVCRSKARAALSAALEVQGERE